jgi:hypothetical protein
MSERDRKDDAMRVGMVIAAGIIHSGFDVPVQAEEILRAAGVTTARTARKVGVDDYDIGILQPIFRTMNRRRRRLSPPPAASDGDRP